MKTIEEIKAEAATCLTRPQHSACNRFALYNECKGDCGYIIKELYDLVLQLESTNHEQFEKIELLQRERDAAARAISDAQHYIKNLGAVQYGLQQLEKWDYYIKQRDVCPENTNQQQEENQGGI